MASERASQRIARIAAQLEPSFDADRGAVSRSDVKAALPLKVAVLGGGVVGMTTTLRLLQRFPGTDVTVITEKETPDTTGDVAAGYWKPYALSGTPDELVTRWARETLEHYHSIVTSGEAVEAGTSLIWASDLSESPKPLPGWIGASPSAHVVTEAETQAIDATGRFKHGYAFSSAIAEGQLYLPWLRRKLLRLGVRFEKRPLCTPSDVGGDYGVVFNCTGLGARALFGDETVRPIRGQVLRVRAPWIKQCFDFSNGAYIIPNRDTVVVGGTTQVDDWQLEPRKEDTERILSRAYEVMPSLRNAEILAVRVGLRPGREGVRVEAERRTDMGQAGKAVLVVHNYGHGGSGLTIGYGTGGDAVELAAKELGL